MPKTLIEFEGGPCAGERVVVEESIIETGMVYCEGAVYRYLPGTQNPFRFRPAIDLEHPAPDYGALRPQDFTAAWTGLMRTLAVYVPRELRREQAALRRVW